MLHNQRQKLIVMIAAFAITAGACSSPVARPTLGKNGSGNSNNGSPNGSEGMAEGAKSVDPATVGVSRIWRLTVQQLQNTMKVALGKDVSIEKKFDPGSRPEDGFGIDADKLAIDNIYASNLETVISEVLASSTAELNKTSTCLKDAAVSAECLDTFITTFAASTFRRPPTEDELKRYKDLYAAVKANGTNDESLTAVAEAMLRSPYTQFRMELGHEIGDNPGVSQLSSLELATQLAFAITNAPPDKELLTAAENGDLLKKDLLDAQIRRLMTSDAFINGFTDFIFRWGGLTWIAEANKNATMFPEYKAEVREAMLLETKAFILDILKTKKGSFKALMTSTDTTITPALAPIYNAGTFTGTKKISLPATERSGLFTMPAIVTANSPANQTGPIQRGVFLLKRLMCLTPPAPPANLSTELAETNEKLTLRERFAAHSNQPACSSCHSIIDPFGFALENYDAIGRFRTQDNGKPVDSSGEITKSASSNTKFKNGVELFNYLSESQEVQECFVKQVFRYTFGRGEVSGDSALLKESFAKFKASDYDINELFASLYSSNAFRFRKEK